MSAAEERRISNKLSVNSCQLTVIVDSVITYTLAPLCELVNVYLTEAQANSLCYKCKHIFRFYYKRETC